MPYYNRLQHTLLTAAIQLALSAHATQLSKSGHPYIFHTIRVMLSLHAEDPEDYDAKIVAVLHDVVEDTPITLTRLREIFCDYLVDAIDAISKRKGESYEEFITRCSKNPLAAKVKRHDIKDNESPQRLKVLTKHDQDRLRKKYKSAIAILDSAPKEG